MIPVSDELLADARPETTEWLHRQIQQSVVDALEEMQLTALHGPMLGPGRRQLEAITAPERERARRQASARRLVARLSTHRTPGRLARFPRPTFPEE